MKDLLVTVISCMLYVCLSISLVIIFLHIATPVNWLNGEQLSSLQSYFNTGLAILVGKFIYDRCSQE